MKARSLHSILLIGALALGGLQGCGTRLEMGSPPRVDRLAQLKPHVSTKQDVLLTLGEPHGVGREFLPFLDHPPGQFGPTTSKKARPHSAGSENTGASSSGYS